MRQYRGRSTTILTKRSNGEAMTGISTRIRRLWCFFTLSISAQVVSVIENPTQAACANTLQSGCTFCAVARSLCVVVLDTTAWTWMLKICWTDPLTYLTGPQPGVQFDCPTGNCTYDLFHTLAFDFECVPMPLTTLELDCKNTSSE